MHPPTIEVISVLPLNSFSILPPSTTPIKEITKVIAIIIDTCMKIVTLFDNPE